jgi:hypothetical protein
MDIEKLRQKRQQLQNDIAVAVSELNEKFKKETKFSPYAIDIQMLETTTMGEKEKQYTVGSCSVSIDI